MTVDISTVTPCDAQEHELIYGMQTLHLQPEEKLGFPVLVSLKGDDLSLNEPVEEQDLFNLFSQAGPIGSIELHGTNAYGLLATILYTEEASALYALQSLNGVEIHGIPCAVTFMEDQEAQRLVPAPEPVSQIFNAATTNVFIRNLPKECTVNEMRSLFEPFGHVVSCKLATNEDGESLCYGFVQFERKQDADEAISQLNGSMLASLKLFVGPHFSKRERLERERIDANHRKFTNLYVKHLSPSTDKKALKKLFEPFGPITSVALSLDAYGNSRNFGFVNFQTHESALLALQTMNNKQVDGRTLYVGRAQKKVEREEELRRQFDAVRHKYKLNSFGDQHSPASSFASSPTKSEPSAFNIYVRNLDLSIDSEQLRGLFSDFASVTMARIMYNDLGASRGYGFVTFSEEADMKRALEEMQGRQVMGKELYVALAQKNHSRLFHNRRTQYSHSQYNSRSNKQSPVPRPNYIVKKQLPRYTEGSEDSRSNRSYFNNYQRPNDNRMSYAAPNMEHHPQRPNIPHVPPPAVHPSMVRFPPPPPHTVLPLSTLLSTTTNPALRKRMIGDFLYPLILMHVSPTYSHFAPKITGMLMELEEAEVVKLVDEDKDDFRMKIKDAIRIIEEHYAQ